MSTQAAAHRGMMRESRAEPLWPANVAKPHRQRQRRQGTIASARYTQRCADIQEVLAMTKLRAPMGLLAAIALSVALCPALAFAAQDAPASALAAGQPDQAALAQAQSMQLATQAKVKIPSAKAAKYYTSPKRDNSTGSTSITVSGITFESYRAASNYGYDNTLTVSFGGSTQTVDTNVRNYTTNGRYLVYAKGVSPATVTSYGFTMSTCKANVYRLDLRTGAKKKLASGKNWTVYSANTKYVYCGASGGSVIPGNLYAVNVKSKAKKRAYDNSVVQVVCSNGRIMFTTMRQQICCSKLYTCGATGANKKLVASQVGGIRIKDGRVMYMQGNSNLSQFRLMTCSFKGKAKKTVKGWQSRYDAFQAKYGVSA